MHQPNRFVSRGSTQAFTLLEMSMVLVLIAVLVASVVIGRSIVTTARLQAVITDADSYITAVNNFRQTYESMPGDFAGATSLWGTDPNGCTTGNGGSGTCNGNGDGKIQNSGSASQVGETFLFWQHLNLAKMSTIAVSNAAGSGGAYDSTAGVNIPTGSIRGSGFAVEWIGTYASSASCVSGGFYCYAGTYNNVLIFGGVDSGYPPINAMLTPEQASLLDAKMDDGMPASGKVLGPASGSGGALASCTNDAVSPSIYNVSSTTSTTNECALMFLMDAPPIQAAAR